MAKTRTNKNSKSKNTNKTRRSKIKKDNKPFLIFASLFVILMIIGYFILGLLFTVFMGVGILIIVGIAKLVDSVKNKPKQKKIVNIDISLSHCKEYAIAYVVVVLNDRQI